EEKKEIGRMKMLEEIAREVCKGKTVIRGHDCISVNDRIHVSFVLKEVYVKDQKHEVDAYNLALASEMYDGKDWTLKTDYDEPNSKE
ncbi:unnamed protein product, partial [marine sediment metagenome]